MNKLKHMINRDEAIVLAINFNADNTTSRHAQGCEIGKVTLLRDQGVWAVEIHNEPIDLGDGITAHDSPGSRIVWVNCTTGHVDWFPML